MSKLLVIAIDALDSLLFEKFRTGLPNLSNLREKGVYSRFSSIWPPDSETAWASIYTGWNPARHGIFRFVDPLEKTSQYVREERDNAVLRGNTFWDIASRQGKRVLVLFPHIGYPSWPVDGVMVTRASVGSAVSITPQGLESRYDTSGLNLVKGLVGRHPSAYLAANRAQMENQLRLTLKLMCESDWDLCFTYWSALDLIQHQFWNYCDPEDPAFPGENPFQNAIRDFYILHDRVAGELVAAAGQGVRVMVLSDHGHGMRPVKIIHINRLLRENGLLYLKHTGQDSRASLLKKATKGAMRLAGRYHLGNVASKALKWIPSIKDAIISAAGVDLERSLAYTTDMSGIKAYAYGGIRIARQNLHGLDYEVIRQRVIALLTGVCDPEHPESPLLLWIKPREQIYSGPFLEAYPDLVFELQAGYGAGWDASGALFDTSASHSLYPGSHDGHNAVFILSGERIRRPLNSLMDIAPTILDILNVDAPEGLDGASILS